MFHFLGLVALGYLAGSGATTNACVVGRGLVRAVKKAVAGDFTDAGVEAAGALAAPVLMTYAGAAGLVEEVVGAAFDLIGQSLEGPGPCLARREAA